MKKLYYATKGLSVDRDGILHEPTLISTSLRGAVKDWRRNHTLKTASIEIRQDTNSGYRVAGEIEIQL